MNKSFTPAILLSIFGAGCGVSSNLADITLVTGLENQSHFKNLLKGFSDPRILSTSAPNCVQKNIFAGFSLGEGKSIVTFPIDMITPFDLSPIDASWIQNNASLPTVKFPVPRGSEVEFGILGAIIQPDASETNGHCRPFGPNGPETTYSLIGHSKEKVDRDMTIPLRVWVLKANSTPIPPIDAISLSNCNQQDNSKSGQECGARNFNSLRCTAGCTASQTFRLEYFYGVNRPEHVVQWISSTDILSGVSVPDMDDLKISVLNGLTELGSVKLREAGSNNSNSADISLSLTDGTTITLKNERYVGNPFKINTISAEGTSVTLTWNSFPGATNYKIFVGPDYDTANSTTVPNNIATAVAGAISQGITFNLSPNQPYYVSVEPWNGSQVLAPRTRPEEVVPVYFSVSPSSTSGTLYCNITAGPVLTFDSAPTLIMHYEYGTAAPASYSNSSPCASFTSCSKSVSSSAAGYYYYFQVEASNTHHGHFISPVQQTSVP